MATVLEDASFATVGELLHSLGDVPADRVLLIPTPGSATEEDVVRLEGGSDQRLCELIDGVLVEKAKGANESRIAALLVHALISFVKIHGTGIVLGADGAIRLQSGGRPQVRIPDVAYYSRERLPDGKMPTVPIPNLVPDLAIEIISPTNTRAEMRLKRIAYFTAGVRLVWEIDPKSRYAAVYTSPSDHSDLDESAALDGGDVLPGFQISLSDLFDEPQ